MPATTRAKEHISSLTRTGLRLLSGYDGDIAITMPRAQGIRLALPLVKTRYLMD
jgi:hypothetical protein